MISLLSLLITLVIWGLIFYILWWGLEKIGLPEPWHKIAVVILVLSTVCVAIAVLTGDISPFPFTTKTLN